MPASSISEVAEDLSAIFKVRREKTARALAEEFVSLYEKSYPTAFAAGAAGARGGLGRACTRRGALELAQGGRMDRGVEGEAAEWDERLSQ